MLTPPHQVPVRLVVSMACVFAGAGFAVADNVAWRANLDTAKIEAAQSKRLVLLHFWTPSCGPCRGLDKAVYSQPQVAQALEQDFVPIKVNADHSPALAAAFGVKRVPTDIVITSQGNVLTTLSCPSQPDAYITQLSGVASHFRNSLGNDPNTSAQPPAISAYAGLKVGELQATPGQIVSNPAEAAAPQTAAAAKPSAETIHNPYAGQQVASEASVKPAAAEVSAANPPMAFDGFCPVSLRTKRSWVKGNDRIGAIHRGQTFLFAGEAEQAQFLANPDAYSPVFSGFDPVLLLDQNRSVAGSRAYGFEYMGAFYLFSSAETKAAFAKNPSGYAASVRQAMNRVDAGSGTVVR